MQLPMTAEEALLPPMDAGQRRDFRRRLLAWYDRHARDLPWRRSHDPYRVWVSEIMLQQTQVETVRPYFERFTAALPDVERLAAAHEQEVLRLWEGLGYYRRARGLHAAAKRIVTDHRGQLPRDVPTLMKLPGIGRYTAGAIASIAYDVRAPILEANTYRLLSRLIGYRGDPAKAAGQRLLWKTAEDLLPNKGVARFNQALMELGSLVCTPSSPDCDVCPAAACCVARQLGAQDQIPTVGRKSRFVALREAAVVVRKKGALLVRQCPEGERWAGLWDFPRFGVQSEAPATLREELIDKVRRQTGVAVEPGPLLKTIRHGVTRFRITLECYAAEFQSGRVRSTSENRVRWLSQRELDDLPLSATGRQIADSLG
ncbi:MAG: A/G-specific adenine glycosylase [Planctomycetota bacterium]